MTEQKRLRRVWLALFTLACLCVMAVGVVGLVRGGDDTRPLRLALLAASAIAWAATIAVARRIKRVQAEEPPGQS